MSLLLPWVFFVWLNGSEGSIDGRNFCKFCLVLFGVGSVSFLFVCWFCFGQVVLGESVYLTS